MAGAEPHRCSPCGQEPWDATAILTEDPTVALVDHQATEGQGGQRPQLGADAHVQEVEGRIEGLPLLLAEGIGRFGAYGLVVDLEGGSQHLRLEAAEAGQCVDAVCSLAVEPEVEQGRPGLEPLGLAAPYLGARGALELMMISVI